MAFQKDSLSRKFILFTLSVFVVLVALSTAARASGYPAASGTINHTHFKMLLRATFLDPAGAIKVATSATYWVRAKGDNVCNAKLTHARAEARTNQPSCKASALVPAPKGRGCAESICIAGLDPATTTSTTSSGSLAFKSWLPFAFSTT
jgi:hypothetical protein